MIMMILSGLWAVDRINKQLDPTIEQPVVQIIVNWQGASAEDIERLAILPIEGTSDATRGYRIHRAAGKG